MIDIAYFELEGPRFYGIFGTMGGSKSKRLVAIGDQCEHAEISFLGIKPDNSVRGNEPLNRLISRGEGSIPGMTYSWDDLRPALEDLDSKLGTKVILLDEYHLFKPEALLEFIDGVRIRRLHLVVCGLVSDFGAVPFELYSHLSILSGSNREDYAAICKVTKGCKARALYNSAIFVDDSSPVPYDPTKRRMPGNVTGDNKLEMKQIREIKYVPACINCFRLPPGAPLNPLDHMRSPKELLKVNRK